MAIGDISGEMKIYDASSWSLITSFQAHSKSIYKIVQSRFKSEFVATCSQDKTVKIWNSFNWTLIRNYAEHSSQVYAIEWLNEDTLASCGETDKIIRIWSVSSGETELTINTNGADVYSLKLLDNNIHLAVGLGYPYDINIYNKSDGSLVLTLQGHNGRVENIIQIRNSDLLASSSDDKTVRLWNLTTNSGKFILQGHVYYVYGLRQVSSDLLASGSGDRTIKVWNITSGGLVRNLTGHEGYVVYSLDLMNNGSQSFLVSGSWDKTIKVWNWSTGELLSSISTGLLIESLAAVNTFGSKISKMK